jgi:hypothetical protein
MSSPVEYEPYDTPYVSQRKDLATESWTPYEFNPTEAQIVEIVGKFDESEVKRLLAQSISDLDEVDARKLLISAAVSTPPVYIEIWGALTHLQMEKKDELARKIQEQLYAGIRLAPQVQHVQQAKLPSKIQEPPVRPGPQLQQAQQTNLSTQSKPSATHTPRALDWMDIREYIQEVDYTINEKYAGLSTWQQHDEAGDAVILVEKQITSLARHVSKKDRPDTKIDAILALCKVGSIVARSGTGVGQEVRRQLGDDATLVRTILGIADLMTTEERRGLHNQDIEALKAFDEERKRHGVFGDFQKVVDTLKKA